MNQKDKQDKIIMEDLKAYIDERGIESSVVVEGQRYHYLWLSVNKIASCYSILNGTLYKHADTNSPPVIVSLADPKYKEKFLRYVNDLYESLGQMNPYKEDGYERSKKRKSRRRTEKTSRP